MPKASGPVPEQSADSPLEVSASARRKTASGPATPAAAVRVLCVDDHAVLVEGLKAQFAIDNQVQCVGYLPTAANLVEEVARLKPHVVLLDIEMPGPDVFEMADRLHHLHPRVRFVFLSAHVRDGYLAAAYKCGAAGYFAKGDELDDIVAGVREAARSAGGVFVMGPKVRQRCQPAKPDSAGSRAKSRHQTEDRPTTTLESLTSREMEVLRLIGKGRSRGEIARELSRSAKTIDGHQERIMRKLSIETRAELMRFAIREGLAEA
jgi:two-component system invasion response regulator UvrY